MHALRTALCLTLISLGLPANAQVVDLNQAYQYALRQDPHFQAERAQAAATRAGQHIARAALLPSIEAAANLSRERQNITQSAAVANFTNSYQTRQYSTPYGYQVNLTQPLFVPGAYLNYRAARAQAQAAAHTLDNQSQALVLTVAQRYFAILDAQTQYRTLKAEQKALAKQLDRAYHQHQVGMSAKTAYLDAKARYDAVATETIIAQNATNTAREQLRILTGQAIEHIADLRTTFSLVEPTPSTGQAWASLAKQHSPALAAARIAEHAAKLKVAALRSGHLPTLVATASAGRNRTGNTAGLTPSETRIVSGGLTLNLPILQGGRVCAETREALQQYQAAHFQRILVERQIASQARQKYRDVVVSIQQIKATQQAIASARSALAANRAGQEVGTRTMVDVLDSQATLHKMQRHYAQAQYQYLLSHLALKHAAGLLSAQDLTNINTLLVVADKRPHASAARQTRAMHRIKSHKK